MKSRIEKNSGRSVQAAALFIAASVAFTFGIARTSASASPGSAHPPSPRNFRAAVRVCAEAKRLPRASTAHGPSDAEREAMHACLTELGFLGPIHDPRVGNVTSVSARPTPAAPSVKRAVRRTAIAESPAKAEARAPSGDSGPASSDEGIGPIPKSLPLSNAEFDEFGPAPATMDEPSGNVTGSESG